VKGQLLVWSTVQLLKSVDARMAYLHPGTPVTLNWNWPLLEQPAPQSVGAAEAYTDSRTMLLVVEPAMFVTITE
jgi:hypothetical protein